MSKTPILIASTVACVAGFLIGISLFRIGAVQFTAHVTLGEAMNTFVALVFVGALTLYAQKTLGDWRGKQDLLFRLGYAVLDNLTDLESSLKRADPSEPLPRGVVIDIDQALTNLSNNLGTLEAALMRCGLDLGKGSFNELKTKRQELKDLITNDPYPTRLEMTIRRATQAPLRGMRDGICTVLLEIQDA